MRMRSLGEGGPSVSVVGLGCNNFGGRVDLEGTRAVVDAALDEGVTLFDTADVYGNGGGSEDLLGRVLEGRRDHVVLATKFGNDMGDVNGAVRDDARGSRDYVRKAVETSLQRLETDRLRSRPDQSLGRSHRHDRRARPGPEALARGAVRLDPATLRRAAGAAAGDLGHGDRLRQPARQSAHAVVDRHAGL